MNGCGFIIGVDHFSTVETRRVETSRDEPLEGKIPEEEEFGTFTASTRETSATPYQEIRLLFEEREVKI
jgi:hypothetical protein